MSNPRTPTNGGYHPSSPSPQRAERVIHVLTAGPDDETVLRIGRKGNRQASLPMWLNKQIAHEQCPWGLVAAIIVLVGLLGTVLFGTLEDDVDVVTPAAPASVYQAK